MNDKADGPAMKVHRTDARGTMYAKIADVHKGIVEAKWKARATGTKFGFSPDILLYLEESIAFLAEEMLVCRAMIEESQDG